jgi:hypothetical protein
MGMVREKVSDGNKERKEFAPSWSKDFYTTVKNHDRKVYQLSLKLNISLL